jgi:hypothetical protein
MAWFRCECGYMAELEPAAGEIISVYHLHREARLDRMAQPCRMERLPDPVPEPVFATAGTASR